MTLTNTEAVTDLSILESLDFEPEFECEHSEHDLKPAAHTGQGLLLIRREPTECGCRPHARPLAICRSLWEWAGTFGVRCLCGETSARDERWTLLAVLR